MTRFLRTTSSVLSSVALLPSVLAAQEHGASREIDIMHHLGNSRYLEIPYWKAPYAKEIALPQFPPVHVGPLIIDFSFTKHLVFLLAAALIVAVAFILTGRSVKRAEAAGRPAKGLGGALEAMSLFIRNEVVIPNVGHHGEKYVPYLLSVFFFVLVCNLLGLLPWGSSATGNIAVTGAMALLSLFVIEISGLKALGFKGYMQTIFFLPPGLPGPLKPVMLAIMTPVEIISKLSKPFALAVRLFANMTAGHVVVLALIGLTFFFRSYVVGAGASVLAAAVMLLELFVSFLQAFVFTLLTSVFIGLIREAH
jgi:F-type H+-transporting ATPase subunit a